MMRISGGRQGGTSPTDIRAPVLYHDLPDPSASGEIHLTVSVRGTGPHNDSFCGGLSSELRAQRASKDARP